MEIFIYENNNKVFMLNVMVNKVVLNIRVHVYKFSKGDGDDVKRNKSNNGHVTKLQLKLKRLKVIFVMFR